MVASSIRKRLERLEATRAQANRPPVPGLPEFYGQMELIKQHKLAVDAGECVYGEGLEPRVMQSMRMLDRFYGRV